MPLHHNRRSLRTLTSSAISSLGRRRHGNHRRFRRSKLRLLMSIYGRCSHVHRLGKSLTSIGGQTAAACLVLIGRRHSGGRSAVSVDNIAMVIGGLNGCRISRTEHGHGLEVEGTHASHEGFLHVLFAQLSLSFQSDDFSSGLIQRPLNL